MHAVLAAHIFPHYDRSVNELSENRSLHFRFDPKLERVCLIKIMQV